MGPSLGDMIIEVLSRLVSTRGAPTFLRSDNGPQFVSKARLSWIVAQGIGTALIEPGKPWQKRVTRAGPCVASSDAAQALHRRDARTHAAGSMLARRRGVRQFWPMPYAIFSDTIERINLRDVDTGSLA